LTDAEIEKMINDAAKFKKADQQAKKRRETIIRIPDTS
jgi:molecular chaperone DnaK (HSP70)